jgi:hypothetical protein
LAYIILQEFIGANGAKGYSFISLNHDQYGVESDADGSLKAELIDLYLEKGIGEITADKDAVLRHIWEVMNCHSNVEKLFSEY